MQVVGSHVVHGGDDSVEHVVEPLVLPGALHGYYVLGVGHHADGGGVPPGTGADGAGTLALGQILAHRAAVDGGLGRLDGLRKRCRLVLRHRQHVEGQPLGRLDAHTGQLGKLLHQIFQSGGEVLHVKRPPGKLGIGKQGLRVQGTAQLIQMGTGHPVRLGQVGTVFYRVGHGAGGHIGIVGHVPGAEVIVSCPQDLDGQGPLPLLHHHHGPLLDHVELVDKAVEVAVLPAAALRGGLGADVGAAVGGPQAEAQLPVVHLLVEGGHSQGLRLPGRKGPGHLR